MPLVVVPAPDILSNNPFVDVLELPTPCVISKASLVPLLVNVNEVGEPSPDGSVNAIFLPVVVVMVLPLLYADCKLS